MLDFHSLLHSHNCWIFIHCHVHATVGCSLVIKFTQALDTLWKLYPHRMLMLCNCYIHTNVEYVNDCGFHSFVLRSVIVTFTQICNIPHMIHSNTCWKFYNSYIHINVGHSKIYIFTLILDIPGLMDANKWTFRDCIIHTNVAHCVIVTRSHMLDIVRLLHSHKCWTFSD